MIPDKACKNVLALVLLAGIILLWASPIPAQGPSPVPQDTSSVGSSPTAPSPATTATPSFIGDAVAYVFEVGKDGTKEWLKSLVGTLLTIVVLALLGKWTVWPRVRTYYTAILTGQKDLEQRQTVIEEQSKNIQDQLLTLRLQLDGKGPFTLRRLDVRYHRILLLGQGSTGKTTLIKALFRHPKGVSEGPRLPPTQELELWRMAHEISGQKHGHLYRYDIYDYRGQDASQIAGLLGGGNDGVLDAKPFTAVVLMVDLFATDSSGRVLPTVRPEDTKARSEDFENGLWDKARLAEHEGWSRIALQSLFGEADVKARAAIIFINKIDLLSREAQELTGDEVRGAFGRVHAEFGRFFQGKDKRVEVMTIQGSAKRGWGLAQLGDILQETAPKL